ncbi:MAG: BamA/TamA family outer membrane protein [Tidjanibacter sp.]|nr:BamA/TamA family outer membrane protein [Tidjanibacter sp.]
MLHRVLLVATIILMATSCNIRTLIPEGQYVLTKNEIRTDNATPKEERISSSEIGKYIKQRPSMDLFNVRAWLYLKANPESQNLWHSLMRALGTPPVLLDSTLTRRSAENIEAYVTSRGFFGAKEEYRISLNEEKRTATTSYTTIQGEPYRIRDVRYNIEDDYIARLLQSDTLSPLRIGGILDINALGEERSRLTDILRREGYYDFSANNIEFQVDTTLGKHGASVEMILHQQLVGYDEEGEPLYRNNPLYRIGSIRVMPNYDATEAATNPDYFLSLDTLTRDGLEIVYRGRRPNIRPSVLRQLIRINSGSMYDDQRVSTTYDNLMGVDYIHSANIIFTPEARDKMRKVTYVGDHWSDTAETMEGVLDCEIRLSPALRQSYKAELETTTTSSFYGISTTLGYQNRNLFRGAELVDMSFTFGYELLKVEDPSLNRNSTELGGMIGITFPQFLFPIDLNSSGLVHNPQTRLEASINRQNRRYYDRVLSNISWGYSWGDGKNSLFSVRPFDVSLVKMNYVSQTFLDKLQNPYLRDSYTTQMMAGISGSYAYGTQKSSAPDDYTSLRAGLSTSGNLLSGIKKLIGDEKVDGHYTLFGIRYAQYVRGDVTWAQSISVGDNVALAYRLYGGLIFPYGNSRNESLPADRLFYAGGVNSMRGWTVRTLGPGSSAEVNSGYPSQFGNLRLEANVELRFPLGGIFDGAAFVDAGNVWYTPNIQGIPEGAAFKFGTALSEVALNTGVGLRLNLNVLVLRLDWGIQLYNSNKPEGARWVIAQPDIRNTALNFGIGYPF